MIRSFLLAACLITPCLAAPPAAPKVRPQMLVSTAWLAEHLKDPDLVLLHVADGFADYKRGHIPGARYLATAKFIDNTGALGSELPSVETLTRTFTELGLTEKSRVVIYATAWMPNAARAYLTLDYLGWGERAALLDGGVEQWLAEDRPVTNQVAATRPGAFTPHMQPAVIAALDDVKQVVVSEPASATCQVVDARPSRRYQAGHLGGATNLYWMETLASEEHPTFLPPDKLQELLASRGLLPGKKVITYCEVGLQASHAYFLFKYLGFDVAMFDGSYQAWTAAKLPVASGTAK
ncbi:sulfurtransferase [Geothrix limicola]|uniref:Sulfurtransferase n=1 Tax=Geothrix limicola TaxID=2927978 RepID=A0ABQ5QDA2_9BACT|nr:rhodanese-like domain-containing protein [Geothrix limicola]GLH72820.1 sulfurtransferase [Geothrix limicola]